MSFKDTVFCSLHEVNGRDPNYICSHKARLRPFKGEGTVKTAFSSALEYFKYKITKPQRLEFSAAGEMKG